MFFKLKEEEKKRLVKEIQAFFLTEREEEIGIIAAEQVLEFFLTALGGTIYNKALDEARTWFKKRTEDLDLDYDLLYKSSYK